MPDDGDISRARQLVRDVILAQSNVFIKEFLLEKGIKGGTAKADFQDQLESAIANGTITYGELTAWVHETEGWGDEHVYLYKIATPVEKLLGDANYARDRADKAGLGTLWNADTSLEFPAERKLTAIQHTEGELSCVWHQGTQFEKRAKDRDFDRVEDDGERYLYKAWRVASRRDVTRIVIRPRFAAVFLPSSAEPKTHGEQRAALVKEIEKVVSMSDWPLYSMGEAIKRLDTKAMLASEKKGPRAQTTRLSAPAGGYIEFASATDMGYAEVEPLREVRSAVRPAKFRGTSGEFRFPLAAAGDGDTDTDPRTIRVQLYGDFDRLRMWVKLTREDVWAILDQIPKRSAR